MLNKQVAQIQAFYPEIYFACHANHKRRKQVPSGLTPRDGSLLAHISALEGIETGSLAKHLGLAKSTLSAALHKLKSFGLIEFEVPAGDGRRRKLHITRRGKNYISETSVLETERVRKVLSKMKPAERLLALQGMELLAAACRKLLQEGANS